MKIKTLTYPSVFILILANSLPLLGILFFSWDVFSILLLYWLETIVIGFFNVLKMLAIGKEKVWPLILVFIIHYLIFNVVHLMLLIFIFAPRNILSNLWFLNLDELFNYLQTIIIALIPLFISHGFSLFFNFLKKKEYLETKIEKQMFQPYKRVIIMHFVLIFTSFSIILFKESTEAVIALVVLKVFFDILGHRAEHYNLLKKVQKI